MHTIAMRYIFERQNVSIMEMRVLEEGLHSWTHKIDLTDSDRWEIKRIVNALEAEERGHFERAKSLLKQHNLHYRQLYKAGLPYIAEPRKTRTFGKG
ncbi:MAG: hypothetical protein WC312_03895 [Candidatus Omnitrophota bacterium]